MPPKMVASPFEKGRAKRKGGWNMVHNINKLKGKITEKGYKMEVFAKEIGMGKSTMRRKINQENCDFYVSETLVIKEKLELSLKDYLDIFFGQELEFNSDLNSESE